MGRFVGKVAVVAGGARGLGERFAQDFVGEGGRVAIADVNAGLGSELAAKLGKDKAVFVGTDVTDPRSARMSWMSPGRNSDRSTIS